MTFLLFVSILFFFTFMPQTDYLRPKWLVYALFANAALGYQLWASSAWWLSIPYLTLTWSSCLFGTSSHLRPPVITRPGALFGVQLETSRTTIAQWSFAIVYLFLTKEIINSVLSFLPYFLIANLIYKVVLPYPVREKLITNPKLIEWRNVFGFGANASVDATLTSIMSILVLCYEPSDFLKLVSVLAGLSGIILNKASTGLFSFVLSATLYFTLVYNLYFMPVILLALFPIANKIFKGKLLALSGRDYVWKTSLKLLKEPYDKILGMGGGVYKVAMPMVENRDAEIAKKSRPSHVFIWAHNDYVQAFLENGVIGIIGILIFIGGAITYMDNLTIVALSVFAFNAVSNFPAHLANEVFLFSIGVKRFFLCYASH